MIFSSGTGVYLEEPHDLRNNPECQTHLEDQTRTCVVGDWNVTCAAPAEGWLVWQVHTEREKCYPHQPRKAYLGSAMRDR